MTSMTDTDRTQTVMAPWLASQEMLIPTYQGPFPVCYIGANITPITGF